MAGYFTKNQKERSIPFVIFVSLFDGCKRTAKIMETDEE
jgi:hypothetical protein